MKSARGTVTAAPPVVLVKLPSDRCLSCKPTAVAGSLVEDLFADFHKAGFVVLVKGAIKYKGEELMLVKEPKNEFGVESELLALLNMWPLLVGMGTRRQNEQADPAAAACTLDLERELFSGSCSLKSLSTLSTEEKKSYSKPIFPPIPKCSTLSVSKYLLLGC